MGAPEKLTNKKEEIEISITTLEKQLINPNVDDRQKKQIWSDIEGKQRELETIIEYQTKERFHDRGLGGTMKVRKTPSTFLTLKRGTVNKEQQTQLKVSVQEV